MIYLLFGLTYKYINPINLSVHQLCHDQTDTSGVKVTISKIRFHISFSAKTNKDVGVVLSDVVIDLRNFLPNSNNSNNKTECNADHQAFNELESEKDYEEFMEKYFDPSLPIIFNIKNRKFKRLAKWLIAYIPMISFQIDNTQCYINSEMSIVTERLSGRANLQKCKSLTAFTNTKDEKNYFWSSGVDFQRTYLYDRTSSKMLSKFFDYCAVSLNFEIDTDNMGIFNVEPIITFTGIDFSLVYLFEIINLLQPKLQSGKKDHSCSNRSEYFTKQKLYLYGFVYRLMKRAKFNLQSFRISEIPISKTEINELFSSQGLIPPENVLFASLKIDSLSFNAAIIQPTQVGFSLKFVEESFPLQWIMSLGNMKVSLDFSKFSDYTGTIKQLDILSIPNLLIRIESTMLINVLRVVLGNVDVQNFQRQQTLTSMHFTLTNPIIDISTEQLVLLIKVIHEISNDGSKEKTNHSNVEGKEKGFDKLKRYLSVVIQTSPRFDFNVLIEKPMLLLKSENDNSNHRDMHLLVARSSLVSLVYDASTYQKSLLTKLKANIPDFIMSYQRNNSLKTADSVFTMRDLSFVTSMQLINFKNIKSRLDVFKLEIDFTNIMALNGLSIIYNLIRLNTMKFKAPRKQYREPIKHKNENFQKLFKELPSWFSSFVIRVNSFKFKTASKSIFIDVEELLNESDNKNRFIEDRPYAPASSVIKFSELNIAVRAKSVTSDLDAESETFSEKTKDAEDFYWNTSVKILKTEVYTHNLDQNLEKDKGCKVLNIPAVIVRLYWLKQNICEICTEIETLSLNHGVSSHFILFSSISLLKNVLSYHKHKLFPDLNTSSSLDMRSKLESSPNRKENRFSQIHFKWKIKEAQFEMLMPEDFHLRMDLFYLTGECKDGIITANKRLIRLSVKKERSIAFYSRLLAIETLDLMVKLPTREHEIPKVYLKDKSIRISIPSNFVVHSLFEAITLTVKLTKKFVDTIKSGVSNSRDKITPSGVVGLPNIKLKSKSVAFVLEDDPFESELNMIYQLGLIEQKSRLEKQKQFESIMSNVKNEMLEKISDNRLKLIVENYFVDMNSIVSGTEIKIPEKSIFATVSTCYRSLHKLRVNISKSWIQIVDEFKFKRRSVVERNMKFISNEILFKDLVSLGFNRDLVDFNDMPPLMSLLLNGVNIAITRPAFVSDGNDVRNFINRVGKGVPLNTCWDKIIPMDLSFKASELRMHLKDFPLPMVYIPHSSKENVKCFTLNARLAIAERVPYSDTEYWYKFIPMYSNIDQNNDNCECYSFYAPKTVTSVKAYYEVDCFINTEDPTVITWSMAYQPILRQLNICFDTFSKLSRDPSPKLGVWDKLRNILHGYAKIDWVNQNSEVMINIPNSSDPYKFMLHSAGFSLIFKSNVSWLINDPQRDNERDYFIFRSNSVVFGIPDHLFQPFPCWCSNQLIFFSMQDKYRSLTSMFGYYLNTDAYYHVNADANHKFRSFNDKKFKTRNISLDGEIELKLSMTFQRLQDDGQLTEEFKPHYKNILICPEYVEEGEKIDSYKGFRSDFIHMALNLKAHKSCNNILRISPKSIFEFVKWFKLFSGDLSLPIRNGPLWGEKTLSVDMGSHLRTFKFRFDVKPLFIYHGYRVDLAKPENKSVIALKARIDSFQCDLHERKEKMIKDVDFLDESRSIMKMDFYIGKVDISDIDLRVIGLKFSDAADRDNPSYKFEIYDNDTSWISFDDFEELDMDSIKNSDVNGQILPVLHATKFIYWMNKELSENEFGNENSHDCMIKTQEFPDKKFNHIFDVNQLKLKWYKEVRNLIFEYVSELSYRAAYAFGTSYKARSEIMNKLHKSDTKLNSTPTKNKFEPVYDDSNGNSESPNIEYKVETAEEFANALKNSKYNNLKVVPVDDFLIRLEDIQVQIMVDSEADDLILFRTRYNEIEIVTLRNDGWYQQVKKIEHAQRFGTIFKDADLLAISKKEYLLLNKDVKHYGTEGEWPPFLYGDEPDNFIESRTILSDILVYFIFEKASNTYSGGKFRNKLYLHVPKLKTKIDSATYLSFFTIVTKVMMYTSPQQKAFAEMVQAVSLASDEGNFKLFVKKLEDIWMENYVLETISESLSLQRLIAKDSLEMDTMIRLKQSRIFFSSVLLIKLINLNLNPESSQDDDNCFMEWSISADHVDMDLIYEGSSFMNLRIEKGSFERLEMIDGSSQNQVVVRDIKILNNDCNILFPEALTAYKIPDPKGVSHSNFMECSWQLGKRQRGMVNIRDINITCSPMKICLEDSTGFKLIDFFFPDELKIENNDSSEGDTMEDEEEDWKDLQSADKDIRSSDNSIVSSNQVMNHNVVSPKKFGQQKKDERKSASKGSNESSSLISCDSKNEARSETSAFTDTSKTIEHTYSSKLNKQIIGDNFMDINSAIENLIKLGINTNKASGEVNAQSLIKMSEKAKELFVIKRMCMKDFILNITFSGKGKFRLINVNDLILKVPQYVVNRKLWTSFDIINSIKKHVIKTLLKQTGKLLRNKMFVYRRHKRVNKSKRKRHF